jgi:mannose-1-phosphate guanylyltransferase
MKAFLLIGGRGTRLKPLTDYIPKCCLPVAGVPLLHLWLRKLDIFGVTHILLNPLYEFQPQVLECVEQYRDTHPELKATICFRSEYEPIGTAQTVKCNIDSIDEENFLVIYGDILTNIDLKYLHYIHEKNNAIVTMQVNDVDNPSMKGVVTRDAEYWATDFQEKPENPESNLAFSGIFCAKKKIIEFITPKYMDFGYDVFPKMIKDGKHCMTLRDPITYFRDIGTIEDYLDCQAEWRRLNGQARL